MISGLTKNATIISGALIFLGYCRYQFYYGTFGIPIYNYISTTELLLSFLPVIVSYFIPIALLVYLVYIRPEAKYRTKSGIDITKRIKQNEENKTPDKLAKHIFFNRRISGKLRLKLFIRLILAPLFWAFCWLVGLTIEFWTSINNAKSWSEIEPVFYIISIGWILFFIEPYIEDMAMNAKRNLTATPNYPRVIKSINIFLIITYFIFFSQKINAWKVLNRESITKVEIVMKTNEKITTDSSFAFIGQTSNYVYFRKLSDSTNLIIGYEDIYKFTKRQEK